MTYPAPVTPSDPTIPVPAPKYLIQEKASTEIMPVDSSMTRAASSSVCSVKPASAPRATTIPTSTVELDPSTPGLTAMLNLKVGTRVRWHAMPTGILFGRVMLRRTGDLADWLYVNETNSGRRWALNPAVDFIAVLSAQ